MRNLTVDKFNERCLFLDSVFQCPAGKGHGAVRFGAALGSGGVQRERSRDRPGAGAAGGDDHRVARGEPELLDHDAAAEGHEARRGAQR